MVIYNDWYRRLQPAKLNQNTFIKEPDNLLEDWSFDKATVSRGLRVFLYITVKGIPPPWQRHARLYRGDGGCVFRLIHDHTSNGQRSCHVWFDLPFLLLRCRWFRLCLSCGWSRPRQTTLYRDTAHLGQRWLSIGRHSGKWPCSLSGHIVFWFRWRQAFGCCD